MPNLAVHKASMSEHLQVVYVSGKRKYSPHHFETLVEFGDWPVEFGVLWLEGTIWPFEALVVIDLFAAYFEEQFDDIGMEKTRKMLDTVTKVKPS